jgi:hypothetical protein
MKILLIIVFISLFSCFAAAQKISFSGTVFDYNGALVPGAKVTATADKSNIQSVGISNDQGQFQLELEHGMYAIEVTRTGFLTIKYSEFLIVNSASGMKMDFVMFGARYHEPCGVSGGDCLPARMLIRDFSVKYSPNLKQLIEDFSDLNKNKKNK